MDENKQSVSIHFRANKDDQTAIGLIKAVHGLTTNAAALRLAVRLTAMHADTILEQLILWHGTDAFGITPPGTPVMATAFSQFFDLEAAAKIEEGVSDEAA